MARSILLPTRGVRPMTDTSLDMLNETATQARNMFSIFVQLPPTGTGRLLDATMRLMRRWSVEIVLVVGEKGSVTFGELSRQLGLRSGSLTPRLRDLEATGILVRKPAGDAQGRVLYELTPRARPLADASYALTLGKAYHHARVREASWAKPLPALDPQVSLRAQPKDFDAHAKGYLASASAFRAEHAAASAEGDFEDALETAQRYRVACTRKWHATVLWTLSTIGPLTFGQLKDRIGAGDEALSTALRGLTELQNIERDDEGGSPEYRMAPFGLFDMSLGMGAVFVYDRIQSELEDRSSLVA